MAVLGYVRLDPEQGARGQYHGYMISRRVPVYLDRRGQRRTRHRPRLDGLQAYPEATDTIVVAPLDRLARSLARLVIEVARILGVSRGTICRRFGK